MRKVLAPLVLALFIVGHVHSEEKAKAAFDPAKLVGDWKISSGLRGGEKISEMGMKTPIKVSKETITLGTGDMTFVMGYKLDTKAKPVTIDMVIKSGPAPEGTKAIGIIGVDGGKAKLCYVVDDGSTKRPTKFESTKDNNAALFELVPVKQ